jgi:hypothetical protein
MLSTFDNLSFHHVLRINDITKVIQITEGILESYKEENGFMHTGLVLPEFVYHRMGHNTQEKKLFLTEYHMGV